MRHASPIVHQRGHEIQPFGHLVRMPIALMAARSAYSRMFSAAAVAILLLVTGASGFQPTHGFFEGKWVSAPVWSQIGLGLVFLAVAVYSYGQINRHVDNRPRLPPQHVGSGRSSGAADHAQHPLADADRPGFTRSP
jgi:hypothetical protein